MQKRERREKLCLLMFTRDNYDEAIGKAIGYSKYLDLIIVVDNSSYPPPPLHNSLKHKIQVFRVFSPGYADPLFYYGVQKALKLGCGYVTLFSVDEELPERLLKDLREVVKDCDAYLLKILITTEDHSYMVHEYFHPRIFKPEKAFFSGIIHFSDAQVDGRVCALDSEKYFLVHMGSVEDLKVERLSRKLKRYVVIESFERPAIPKYLLLYSSIGRSRIGKRILAKIAPLLPILPPSPRMFNLYEILWDIFIKIHRKVTKTSEVSICPSNVHPLLCPKVFKKLYNRIRYKYMLGLSAREIVTRVKIADEIHKNGGVIRYLCLDQEDVVHRITEIAERIKGFGGVDFFVSLLKLRFISGDCSYIKKLNEITMNKGEHRDKSVEA